MGSESNRNFKYKWYEGDEDDILGPQYLEPSISNNRALVDDPSIKEPYFLEGPGHQETWNFLQNLNPSIRISLGAIGAGGKFFKRSDPEAVSQPLRENTDGKAELSGDGDTSPNIPTRTLRTEKPEDKASSL
ncbi:hypothetical protein TWF694_009510 [Orbilia ellipsospora]|uniref:Uncharacterized protein n=1 Tax=Orbilia ellipsospora TaxID=2528407 RepID=A0AAV9XAZ9_9PEZI